MSNSKLLHATRGSEINIFESYDEEEGYGSYIAGSSIFRWVSMPSFTQNYSWRDHQWKLREPTQEEKEWYYACKKADDIIPRHLISNILFPIY